MDLITIDFETAYDQTYSLAKLQLDEYVLDSRFEVIGVGIKLGESETKWVSNGYSPSAVETALNEIDWDNSAIICHNTLFDGFILTQIFDKRPKLWIDTLAMGRMLFPWLESHSLSAIAKELHLGVKGDEVLHVAGKWLKDFSVGELDRYGEYCKNDVELTYSAAKLMLNRTPLIELKLIDMTVRMFTEPQFVGDIEKLNELYKQELKRKETLMEAANINREMIMSNDKFAAMLREFGVEPPMKVSPRTGKLTYAFAKSDAEFTALLEHPNIEVQTLVAARLGVKTTIAETRTLRMLETAQRKAKLSKRITTEQYGLPVYLNFWGAKTTGRYSGGNKINWQNLPARGVSAGIRHALRAPIGHKVIVGDSSNIELRVAMCCAGQTDVVNKLAEGVDLYCDFATKLFGREITTADTLERQIGKIAMLSLQYGAGWAKFKEMVRIQAGKVLTDDEARTIVDMYRYVHNNVVELWNYCDNVILPEIYNNEGNNLLPVDVNGWCITNNSGFSVVGMPGIVYKNLHVDNDGNLVYKMGKNKAKIYGGKVVENLCQYVARQIVMWQTARINEKFPVALSVHDEVVCIVPDEKVDECVEYMKECLTLAPKWCRGDIPLACKIGIGATYGDAK